MGPDDKLVLSAITLGTVAAVLLLRHRGARGLRLFAAGWAAFYGVVLVAMLSGHCIEIGYNTLQGSRGFDGTPFAYNWRTYSLLLFGGVLIRLGVRALRAALGIGGGEAGARGRMLGTVGVVLAIVLPIIPIHPPFGYLISGISALTLAVVALAAREPDPGSGRHPFFPLPAGIPGVAPVEQASGGSASRTAPPPSR